MGGDLLQVLIREGAARALRDADDELRGRLVGAIDRLKRDPFPAGAETIKGAPGYRRVRVGDYRIVYNVDHRGVEVALISHRKDVYRKLYRLLW